MRYVLLSALVLAGCAAPQPLSPEEQAALLVERGVSEQQAAAALARARALDSLRVADPEAYAEAVRLSPPPEPAQPADEVLARIDRNSQRAATLSAITLGIQVLGVLLGAFALIEASGSD